MAKNDKNTAPVMNQNEIAVPEGWEEAAIGFPPYWTPVAGASFKGKVIGFDPDADNDGAFPRFTILATSPLLCHRGPVDDRTEVQIKAGEQFNVSQWAALPLENFMGFEVMVTAIQQRPIAGGKTVWEFKLCASPDTLRLVAERQAKMLAEANAAIPTA